MVGTLFSYLLALLLLCCLASFGWGMCRFFTRPDRMTLGMKVTAVLGAAFAFLYLWAILAADDISVLSCSIAASLCVSACGLFWWAVGANWKRPLPACFSPNRCLHLNRRGPYRFVRHPFYCSYLLAWFTGVVATGNLWLLPTALVMLAIYASAARREEEHFACGPLADDYREYRNHTGQLVPNPRKLWARTGSFALRTVKLCGDNESHETRME